MKLMVASDIHGCADACEKLLKAFAREGAEKLVLLGDLLYHGPRNGIPEDYDPVRVIGLLNGMSSSILAIRGNCDSEVDQMVLDFPIMADFAAIFFENRMFYLTHGHVHNSKNPPKLQPGAVVLSGHTHVPLCEKRDGALFMNPGSAAIPKDGSVRGYLVLDAKGAEWKDLDGAVFMSHAF